MLYKEDEICDFCKECQKRHIKTKGLEKDEDGNFMWSVNCDGIPKTLWDDNYFPAEKFYSTEEIERMSDKEFLDIQYRHNILLWAKDKLGWSTFNPKRKTDQWYQKGILLCNSKTIAVRLARRMGKSEMMIIKGIHFADTSLIKNPSITIFTPFGHLIESLYERIKGLLESDSSAFKDKFTSKMKPFKFKFDSGATITLFTTGSNESSAGNSSRGSIGDFLIIDEAAYMPSKAIETIYALKMEYDGVPMFVSSTPSGIPSEYKTWCLTDKRWKDFHYPFSIMPQFKSQEKELRDFYTEEGYAHEVEAEFYETSEKIFKDIYIERSLKEFSYIQSISELVNKSAYETTIGIDWNGWKNGVNITVLGRNKFTGKYKTLLIERILDEDPKEKDEVSHLQSKAISRIIELYHKFEAKKVIADTGYGSMQCELLSQYFNKIGELDVFKGVTFEDTLRVKNPLTEDYFSKSFKELMVYMTQQLFILNLVELSSIEEGTLHDIASDKPNINLVSQLSNYFIKKFMDNGRPVFACKKADHKLDSFMLAVLGFTLFLYNTLSLDTDIRMVGRIRGTEEETKPKDNIIPVKQQIINKPSIKEQIYDIYEEDIFGNGSNELKNFKEANSSKSSFFKNKKTISSRRKI